MNVLISRNVFKPHIDQILLFFRYCGFVGDLGSGNKSKALQVKPSNMSPTKQINNVSFMYVRVAGNGVMLFVFVFSFFNSLNRQLSLSMPMTVRSIIAHIHYSLENRLAIMKEKLHSILFLCDLNSIIRDK